jgi:filamentous hemagglutinin family protein
VVSRSWLAHSCHLGLLNLLFLSGLLQKQGGDRAFAQVVEDPSLNTKVMPDGDGTNLKITGGTTVGDTNLFHSFSSFSIESGKVVNFDNAATINNILVRVTGGNPSQIQGTLRSQGKANLFLINPKGIVFGENARLNIRGSFIGTTASAIQFPDGGEFSMTSPVNPLNPLLKVNPSALLFNQIAAEPISSIQVNETNLLSVPDSQSLLLVGGDVNIDGGRLRATSGRIELGGLAAGGTVGLNVDNNNFRLSFPLDVARADLSLSNGAIVTAPDSGGSIQVQGRRVRLTDDSEIRIINTFGTEPGGTLAVTASESVKLQGGSRLLTITQGSGDAGNLKIETGQLIIEDGSQVSASTRSEGGGGKLSVTAKDSIQLIGTSQQGQPSGLFSATQGAGSAGNLEIETGQLIVGDGASISASTLGESTGVGGSIIVRTGELNVLNGAEVAVSSRGAKQAGNLEITARSIKLDNQGKLIGQTASADGGNITLNLRDFLLLRRNSQISTSAGIAQKNGNGGNIKINAPDGFIVAARGENSDITANAFSGSGGQVIINTTDIFGIEPLSRQELERLRPNDLDSRQLTTNDITAISRTNPNLSGTVTINTPDVDPSRGLVNLPTVPLDAEVAQACQPRTAQNQSSFTITGRGGLPPNPRTEPLSSDAVQVDWVTLKPRIENRASTNTLKATSLIPATIVEAQGWVRNAKGEVVLTAFAPRSSWHKPAPCSVYQSTK